MAELNTKPSSSTTAQHKALVIAGLRRGMSVDDIRHDVGGSITALSAEQCSKWITRYTGRGLPNPPGQKPKTYKGRPAPGTVRMITGDQVDQIYRLGLSCFDGCGARFIDWLSTTFKVTVPGDLATSKRAGEVIRVLKQMQSRRNQ